MVTSEKDTGIYNAMNKGVKAAKGDFISFLNAGDWYELDALKNINAFYQEKPFELTYGGLHYINPNGTVTNKMSKNDEHGIVTSRHWNHPSMFLSTELYKHNGFDETFPAYADFNLYLKMRKQGVKIRVIDKVSTLVMIHQLGFLPVEDQVHESKYMREHLRTIISSLILL